MTLIGFTCLEAILLLLLALAGWDNFWLRRDRRLHERVIASHVLTIIDLRRQASILRQPPQRSSR